MNVDGNNFFIQDATGAIDVFAGGGANPTKDQLLRAWQGRYAIQITAARGSFNGLEQLATITEIMIVDKIGSAFPTPTVVTSIADLSTYKAQQIRLQGLVFVSQAKDSFGNIDFTFTLGSENVVVRWDSRNGTPVGFPLTLVEGDIIDAVVGVFWSNAARLRIDSKGAFTLPPMTIAAALTQAADTVVTIRGYVTLNVDGNNFLFQDNTGALDVFLGSGASAEKDAIRAAFLGGYAIEIQATRGAFRGLQQVSSVQFVNVIPTPGFNFPTAVNVTAMDVTALNTYIAQLVEFKGLEVVSIAYDNFGNLDINVTNGTATFSIRWDARTGAPSGLPTELEAGDIINVVAGA
jgi:DNA/RNA endonuclease YhcR with UshA esterase domain